MLMNPLLIVVAAVVVIALVVGRQLLGEPMRAKRLIVLPLALAAVGLANLNAARPGPLDLLIVCLSATSAVAIGLGQGRAMRLSERDGVLWGQLPPHGLWWWAALIGSRLLLGLLATLVGAHVAASGASILLVLGLNRLSQAGVVAMSAVRAGIPFAPETNGASGRGNSIAAGIRAGLDTDRGRAH
jgi:hypothetical protein